MHATRVSAFPSWSPSGETAYFYGDEVSDIAVPRSVVVPVYNGAATIEAVVDGLLALGPQAIDEIVLVNDGSEDDSERVCRELASRYRERITYVQLSRNFGEHAAVTAGFRYGRGRFTAVVDDDGQHPPEEVLRLFQAAEAGGHDAVYGRLVERKHSLFRRLLSGLHNVVACRMLGKPRGLYLSSFKVVNRFLADQIAAYEGPFPYVDGVILSATRRVTQIDVLHRSRHHGRSGYTLAKLWRLWRTAFLGWSTAAFRSALALGAASSLCGLLAAVVVAWCQASGEVVSSAWLAGVGGFFAGMILLQFGLLAVYLCGATASGPSPRPYLVKYVLRGVMQHA